jgi:hypothetical protein
MAILLRLDQIDSDDERTTMGLDARIDTLAGGP